MEKQHEVFLYQMLGFSVCMVTMRKPFARSTVLVCTDSWHGFPHGFFARIFCADVNREFLHGSWHVYLILYLFLRRFFCMDFCVFFAQIFARILSHIFCADFLGCPKLLAGKPKI